MNGNDCDNISGWSDRVDILSTLERDILLKIFGAFKSVFKNKKILGAGNCQAKQFFNNQTIFSQNLPPILLKTKQSFFDSKKI